MKLLNKLCGCLEEHFGVAKQTLAISLPSPFAMTAVPQPCWLHPSHLDDDLDDSNRLALAPPLEHLNWKASQQRD
jgi:hypothetical protein